MRNQSLPSRSGVTLVELLVVIALLAILASVSVIASARVRARETIGSARGLSYRAMIVSRIAAARRDALRNGQAVVIAIDDSSVAAAAIISATALPDGSVIGDSFLEAQVPWDRLSGKPSTANSTDTRGRHAAR
jgi:prepilin-type N-terminal cleavage/methylation domain-containing protein